MDRQRLVWLLGLVALVVVVLLARLEVNRPTPVVPANPATHSPAASDSPTPPPPGLRRLPAAATESRLIDELRNRLGEEKLREIARRSVSIEDRARENLGESEAAYARMAADWAALCQELGISEAHREAIEDEAIRQGWLSPPPR